MRIFILIALMSLPQLSFAILHNIEIYAEFATSAKRNTAKAYFENKSSCCARVDEAYFYTYDVDMASHTGYGLWASIRLTDANKTIKDELKDKIQLMNPFIVSCEIWYHKCRHDVTGGCCDTPQILWSK